MYTSWPNLHSLLSLPSHRPWDSWVRRGIKGSLTWGPEQSTFSQWTSASSCASKPWGSPGARTCCGILSRWRTWASSIFWTPSLPTLPCLPITTLVRFNFLWLNPPSPSYSLSNFPSFLAGCLAYGIDHNPDDEDEDGDEEEEADVEEEGQPGALIVWVIGLRAAWVNPTSSPACPWSCSPFPPLLCQLQMIFETTATDENIGVIRVVIALADNLYLAEPQAVVHFRLALPLNGPAIGAPVVALHQLRLLKVPPSAATHTGKLGHRAAPPARGWGRGWEILFANNTCRWSRLPGWGWSPPHPPASPCLSPPRQMLPPQVMSPGAISFSDFVLNIGCLYFGCQAFSASGLNGWKYESGNSWRSVVAGRGGLQKRLPATRPACRLQYFLLSYWRNTSHCLLIGCLTLQPAFCTCGI